jgi:hypothetical protein
MDARSAARSTVSALRRAPSALVALLASTAASSGVVAAGHLPPSWPDARWLDESPAEHPLAEIGSALCALLPGGLELAPLLLSAAASVAVGTAGTFLGFQLFRGPGRVPAAIVAGPLATLMCLGWIRAETGPVLAPLVFTLLAILGVAALVRPLVHLGRVTPVAASRSLAAALSATAIAPAPGLPLVAAVAAVCLIRSRRPFTPVAPGASLPRATMSGGPSGILIVGAALPVLAGLCLWLGWPHPRAPLAFLTRIRPISPPLTALLVHADARLVYPALSLVGLLVLPLRWRGGVTLLVLFGGALVVGIDGRPLAPMPVLLVGLGVAASGWVWLAGTVVRRRPLFARGLAWAAALVLAGLCLPGPWARGPIAPLRPLVTPGRIADRALEQPGDVLVAHDPALWAELSTPPQRLVRPDREIAAASAVADLPAALADWEAAGRRVSSDGFGVRDDLDPAALVADWPLFRLLPARAPLDDAADEELPAPPLDASPAERRRWQRMLLEHARHRRAVGRDAEAVLALPLGDRDDLRTLLRISRAVNLPADAESYLGPSAETDWTDPDLAVIAEIGDLLYAAGERELGAERLRWAATRGHVPAWRALARWHLSAGEQAAADDVVEHMRADPSLHAELVGVAEWLTARGRLTEAERLVTAVPATTALAPRLVALRVRLLAARAVQSSHLRERGQ